MKGPQRIEKWMENTQIIFLIKDLKKLHYGATKAVLFLHKRNIENSI